MDQRRLLIASAISLLLIFAYQELVLSRYQKRQAATEFARALELAADE